MKHADKTPDLDPKFQVPTKISVIVEKLGGKIENNYTILNLLQNANGGYGGIIRKMMGVLKKTYICKIYKASRILPMRIRILQCSPCPFIITNRSLVNIYTITKDF